LPVIVCVNLKAAALEAYLEDRRRNILFVVDDDNNKDAPFP
jgi:hypothetical protein